MGLGSSWSGDAAYTAFLSSRELQPEALVRPSPWTWACGEAGDGRAVGEGKVWPLLGVGCGCRRPGDTSLRPAGVLPAWPQPGRPIAASDGSWLSSHFNSLASSRRDRDFAGEEPATLWRVHTDPRWARAEPVAPVWRRGSGAPPQPRGGGRSSRSLPPSACLSLPFSVTLHHMIMPRFLKLPSTSGLLRVGPIHVLCSTLSLIRSRPVSRFLFRSCSSGFPWRPRQVGGTGYLFGHWPFQVHASSPTQGEAESPNAFIRQGSVPRFWGLSKSQLINATQVWLTDRHLL